MSKNAVFHKYSHFKCDILYKSSKNKKVMLSDVNLNSTVSIVCSILKLNNSFRGGSRVSGYSELPVNCKPPVLLSDWPSEKY